MNIRWNIRTAVASLILSTALAMPSLAVAQANPAPQQSGGMMGDHKMMPMGDDKMEGEMKMPSKMSPNMKGCAKMKGSMKAKCEKNHKHPVKATTTPTAKPKTTSAAKPATAPQKPKPKPMANEPMKDKMPMPEKAAPMKPGCC